MTDTTKAPRKKLIEHSLPLDAINAASAREKSIRHGHPSTLHLWWARRPLAACRAVIFAQLVDDPSEWPDIFPTQEDQDRERRRLHKVIEDMVEWPKTNHEDQIRFEKSINAARFEIARSIARDRNECSPEQEDTAAILQYLKAAAPPVYDPFCGGGAIPFEAQRLGLSAIASDLNPVAATITRSLIEFPAEFSGLPPVHSDISHGLKSWSGGAGLAQDVLHYGKWMKAEAESKIGCNYLPINIGEGKKANVVAWLWARTVSSPDPSCRGAHVPLASSFVLCSKNQKVILKIEKEANLKERWRFRVKADGVTEAEVREARRGTKSEGASGFECVLSGAPISRAYVQAEGKAGRIKKRLMAVVIDGTTGREYLDASEEFIASSEVSEEGMLLVEKARTTFLAGKTPTRAMLTGGVCSAYGLSSWGDLFTDRQILGLVTLTNLIESVRDKVAADCRRAAKQCDRDPDEYAKAIATYLACAVSKLADLSNSLCRWEPNAQCPRQLFGRQNMPMIWDFAEGNILGSRSGSFQTILTGIVAAMDKNFKLKPGHVVGQVELKDAAKDKFPQNVLISTDPPYYDNIAYADIADFFYNWLRASLRTIWPEQFRRIETPKEGELVATKYRHGSISAADEFFIDGMGNALRSMSEAAADSLPLAVYYAFKQSESASDGVLSPGWAAFLQAMVDAGLRIDGTWPIRTENASRLIASGSNALASSVVLVCRSRGDKAPVKSRRDFLRELKPVMAQAILDHQKAGIPLPDRRQAAIGPGIGVFSKYSMVREPDDSPMRVATALALINKEIDSLLSEGTQELDPETRFALEWYQMHGYADQKGGSGDAIAQLQAFNLSESRLNASGLFRSKGGDAKLLTRDEMHDAIVERMGKPWRPSLDDTFTVWELAQHMARALRAQDGGVDVAGRLLAERRECGPDVLLIAERLFELATTRGENDEALIWNELQTSWPQLENAADRAAEAGVGPAPAQTELEV